MQPVAFVAFDTHQSAVNAMKQFHVCEAKTKKKNNIFFYIQGIKFDPHSDICLRVELAKNNTKTIQKRSREVAAASANPNEKRFKPTKNNSNGGSVGSQQQQQLQHHQQQQQQQQQQSHSQLYAPQNSVQQRKCDD